MLIGASLSEPHIAAVRLRCCVTAYFPADCAKNGQDVGVDNIYHLHPQSRFLFNARVRAERTALPFVCVQFRAAETAEQNKEDRECKSVATLRERAAETAEQIEEYRKCKNVAINMHSRR